MKKIFSYLQDQLNNIRMMNKLMIIYIIGGLIPILIVSLFFIFNIRSILIERATNEAVNNMYRVEDRILEVVRIVTDVSDGLYLDKKLERIIRKLYTNKMDLVNDLNEYTLMDQYLELYAEIESIRMYVDNNSLLDDSQIIKTTQKDKESDWYQQAVLENGRMSFIYKYDEISRDHFLAVVRLVKSPGVGDPLGVLVINISNRYMDKIFRGETYDLSLLLDRQVVFANGTFRSGNDFDNKNPMYEYLTQEFIVGNIRYQGSESKMILDEFGTEKITNSFRLLTLIPIEHLVARANSTVKLSFIMIGISLLISILFVSLLSKLLSDRINRFRKDMHEVAAGDLKVISRIGGEDELGQLSEDLNLMVDSVQKLIHDAYEAELQKEQLGNKQREAEFKMLASQINPHFLYNALETIRMKAHLSGQKEIADVVKKLAKIMRRNLSISNELVSLDAELELVRNYLEIQRFRFGDKVTFTFDVQCETDRYMILPLLLQPLVENAFVHGLERKVGQGCIRIVIRDRDEYRIISVIDDGVGIEEPTLKELQKRLDQDELSKNGSIGLTNVNQRTKLYYGRQYHLEIESTVNGGTTVSLVLPSMKGEASCTES